MEPELIYISLPFGLTWKVVCDNVAVSIHATQTRSEAAAIFYCQLAVQNGRRARAIFQDKGGMVTSKIEFPQKRPMIDGAAKIKIASELTLA